jgi:hypothetical protein
LHADANRPRTQRAANCAGAEINNYPQAETKLNFESLIKANAVGSMREVAAPRWR